MVVTEETVSLIEKTNPFAHALRQGLPYSRVGFLFCNRYSGIITTGGVHQRFATGKRCGKQEGKYNFFHKYFFL